METGSISYISNIDKWHSLDDWLSSPTCPPQKADGPPRLCSDSNKEQYRRMFNFMESARPSVYVDSTDEGVEMVKKSKGLYAYLMESTGIEYELERNCELTQIGGLLDHKSYGIALQPGKARLNGSSGVGTTQVRIGTTCSRSSYA